MVGVLIILHEVLWGWTQGYAMRSQSVCIMAWSVRKV